MVVMSADNVAKWREAFDRLRFSSVFASGAKGRSSGDQPRHPLQTYFELIKQRLDGRGRIDKTEEKMRWLDIGCGRHLAPEWMKGHAEIEADLKSRARSLIGVDPDFLALRDNRSPDARINADAVRLPFADGSFDLVTSNMVFEHIEAPLAALIEIRRSLSDGGRLIVLTPNWLDIVTIAARITPNRWHPAVVTKIEERGAADVYPTYYRFNRPSTVEKMLREAGFGTWSVELLEHPDVYAHAPVVARVEAAWHRLARRWPVLRGALLIDAQVCASVDDKNITPPQALNRKNEHSDSQPYSI